MTKDDFRHDLKLLSDFIFKKPSPDRVLAIVIAAYSETYTGELLKMHMPGLNYDLRKTLFDPERPLGSFAARTDVARAIGVIGPMTHKDLRRIASIRNRFAHNLAVDTFDHEEVATRVDELRAPGYVEGKVDVETLAWIKETHDALSRREKFIRAGFVICAGLHNTFNMTSRSGHPHRLED